MKLPGWLKNAPAYLKDYGLFVFGTLGVGAFLLKAWHRILGCAGCAVWVGVPALVLGVLAGYGGFWLRRRLTKRLLVIVPDAARSTWQEGKQGDKPCLILAGDWLVTAPRDQDVGLLDCWLVKPVRVEMQLLGLEQGIGIVHVPAGNVRRITAFGSSAALPPVRAGNDLKATVEFRDHLGTEHRLKNMVFRALR